MIRLFSWGLFMQIGHPDDRSDWVHVDNLVEAIICASERRHIAGQAFFVGDGQVKQRMCSFLFQMC
jgi:nucleoside-diphosphate-sugar epimerase